MLDLEIAYRLCQDLLRESGTQRTVAELVIQTLHCLEKDGRQYIDFTPNDQMTWMSEQWRPFPPKITDDPPSPIDPVLMTVKDAILRSDRSSARAAIAHALRSHLDRLSEPSRDFVRQLLDDLSESEPHFSP
jgi:hypothetical protein